MGVFDRKTLPVVLQTEMTECGLACIVMIARYHGQDVDLNALRKTAAVSLKGASLKQVMETAGSLHLASRPLRCELEQLHKVQTPAILHWDLNHFVVLKKVKNGKVHFIDPGRGLRIMALEKVSDHFSGVVLELSPAADFNKIENRLKPRLELGQPTVCRKERCAPCNGACTIVSVNSVFLSCNMAHKLLWT